MAFGYFGGSCSSRNEQQQVMQVMQAEGDKQIAARVHLMDKTASQLHDPCASQHAGRFQYFCLLNFQRSIATLGSRVEEER
jgi:hypothetical protein